VGAPRVRRWQKIPCSGLVVSAFELRAHAVHRYHVDVRHREPHVTYTEIAQDAIYTLSIERQVNTGKDVYASRIRMCQIPLMIRPSSLIGMDEQVFKAVCTPPTSTLTTTTTTTFSSPHPNANYPPFAHSYIPMNSMTYQTFTPSYAPAEVSVRVSWLMTTEILLTIHRCEMG